jgi:hypothetical protein
MRAFGDAIDVLQTRLESLEKLSALDRRHADLTAWASERRLRDVTAAARGAEARAKAAGADDGAIRAYERALDQLRDSLVRPTGASGGSGSQLPPGEKGPRCTDPSDPMCGLDGRPL